MSQTLLRSVQRGRRFSRQDFLKNKAKGWLFSLGLSLFHSQVNPSIALLCSFQPYLSSPSTDSTTDNIDPNETLSSPRNSNYKQNMSTKAFKVDEENATNGPELSDENDRRPPRKRNGKVWAMPFSELSPKTKACS
jgi:hypothetical protein